mmetsp:Transcript_7988/g.18543  ORF Transcript_7988/g.18543 Transcript_7988/m.18543 type:complete len:230 (-) Transcript_7988:346-1035(-)
MPVFFCKRNQHVYSSSSSGMPTASLARAKMLSLAPSSEAEDRNCFSLNRLRISFICSASLSSEAASSSVASLSSDLRRPFERPGNSLDTFFLKKSLDDFEGTTPRSRPIVVPVRRNLVPVVRNPPLMAPVIDDLLFFAATPSSVIDIVVARAESECRDAWRLSWLGGFLLNPARTDSSSSLSGRLSDASDVAKDIPETVVLVLRSCLRLSVSDLMVIDVSPGITSDRTS